MINPITYIKTIWKNRETALTTPVNATNLNHIENGIDAVTAQSNETAAAVNALTQDITGGIVRGRDMTKDGNLIKGLSTDTKPTEIDPTLNSMPVREGDIFLEADTGDTYFFIGGEWVTKD